MNRKRERYQFGHDMRERAEMIDDKLEQLEAEMRHLRKRMSDLEGTLDGLIDRLRRLDNGSRNGSIIFRGRSNKCTRSSHPSVSSGATTQQGTNSNPLHRPM
jgi:predicted nuclease with TOPRIM domain